MDKYRKNLIKISIIFVAILTFSISFAQKNKTKKSNEGLKSETFNEFKLRNIGPSFMSGRISDIAIHPENPNIWYVAVGSGGVWKTMNSGVTWNPIFDKQSVYSTGCITIDEKNPHTIWLGTGENVGGRHVGFGDGIYRSTDDGQTWKNMGLKKSEHISKIIVHPDNSNIVFAAVQGPLWSKGGERGFFKTINGGKTWKKTLGDKEWTGVTDIILDSRNPQIIYAATWQRHRNIAAYMGGGPKTAIHKSIDGGSTWKKLTTGLPKNDLGKIGLAISPQNPDVIYAAIELERRKGAIYRSENKGESWTKQSDAVSGATGPHYYQELYASPHQFDRIYLADVRMQVSDNGGKTFRTMKEDFKHSDNHSLTFRKNDPNYLLVGTDGGIYESYDLEENWRFISNLPITQFYKVAVDDAAPFYNVYGGTQDNSTQVGPSRTDNRHGIAHFDWEIILGGDGHQPATEPGNPNIVYAESQEGFLFRIDRKTGETVFIQPQPGKDEDFERFNWDSPILVSPHSPKRLYFASQRVWKSDNRGDEWIPISGDLTKNQERFSFPIMGKNQSWDAAWDIYAMSTYNTITSISESPEQEGLIYVGTDDGLIQVTENGGKTWRKTPITNLPGVPMTAFVNDIKTDLFNINAVYTALDNHKFGDFKPYLFKSSDKGKNWKSIKGDLPDTLMIWRFVQDHKNKNLLFIGTEFGIYFSVNGGNNWLKLSGSPTISFRDLTIQRHENDLVGASFGRGLYILDDYSPLREITENKLKNNNVILFKPRDAWWYIERSPLGRSKKGSQGNAHFIADNPPYGAMFSYYLKDDLKTKKEIRKEKEKKLKKENANINFPGWNNLDNEASQEKPTITLNVLNDKSEIIRKINGSVKKGIHRVNWDLRMSSKQMISLNEKNKSRRNSGFLVIPGNYKVFLSKKVDGLTTIISDTTDFKVIPLREGTLKGADYDELAKYWQELSDMQSEISLFYNSLSSNLKKAKAMKIALKKTNIINPDLTKKVHTLNMKLVKIQKNVFGSPSKKEVGEKTKPTISSRLSVSIWTSMNNTYGSTNMLKSNFEIAKEEYTIVKKELKLIAKETIPELEKELKKYGAPYIEGQELP